MNDIQFRRRRKILVGKRGFERFKRILRRKTVAGIVRSVAGDIKMFCRLWSMPQLDRIAVRIAKHASPRKITRIKNPDSRLEPNRIGIVHRRRHKQIGIAQRIGITDDKICARRRIVVRNYTELAKNFPAEFVLSLTAQLNDKSFVRIRNNTASRQTVNRLNLSAAV